MAVHTALQSSRQYSVELLNQLPAKVPWSSTELLWRSERFSDTSIESHAGNSIEFYNRL